MNGAIIYYGMDQSLKTVEHGPVNLEQALDAVNQRFSRLKPKYASAEEALAETMFGFSLNKDTFIEICINAPDKISFKFEFPIPRKFLGLTFQSVYQKELQLSARDAVIERVRHFFNSATTEEYKNYLNG